MRYVLVLATALLLTSHTSSVAQSTDCTFSSHRSEHFSFHQTGCNTSRATQDDVEPSSLTRAAAPKLRTRKKIRQVAPPTRVRRVKHTVEASYDAPVWLTEAQRWLGARARDLGVRRNLWCAAGLNKWLQRVGLRGTRSDAARSFASYGRPSSIRPGAIAVMTRGRYGGHVGIVVKDLGSHVRVLGANQGNRVSYHNFPKRRIYAYRWPR